MCCKKTIFTDTENFPDFPVEQIEAVRTDIFMPETVIYSESPQNNPIRENKSTSENIII